MTILVINNKGQYNHRIQRSLQYLKIPTELVPNTLSIEEIEAKNPMEDLQLKVLEIVKNILNILIYLF